MRCSRGQATTEYVALVAVLAIVLAAGLVLAGGFAAGIVNAVAGQIRHALCVVGGGPCPGLRSRPCTVASTRDARHVAVNLVLLRIDYDRYVLREELSDGTVRLTVARSGGLGAEGGVGGRANVTVRGRQIGVTDELRVGAQAMLGSGRVFVARDTREAAAFLRAIRDGDDPPAPAREVFFEGGARGLATIGAGSSVAGASLRALGSTLAGARRDRRTGDLTLTVHSGGSGWGAVTAALGGPVGTVERATTLGLTLDRRGRAIELSLSAAGSLSAGSALPPGLSRALGGATALSAGGGGRRWELAARLDLRDPLVAGAWRRFRDDPASAEAIGLLGAAIRDRAQLDARAYRTDSAYSGAAAGVGVGVQLGGELDRTVERSRLLAARSRPAGGLWERRLDCLA